MTRNNERLKAMETHISNLATLMSQWVTPPKDEAPIKEITIDVTDKAKDVLIPKKLSAIFPQRLKGDKRALDIFDGEILSNFLDTRKPCFKTPNHARSLSKSGLRSINNTDELHFRCYGPYIMIKIPPYWVVKVTKGYEITFGVNRHHVKHYEEELL
ncbi:hypothetical protein CR513_05977, partial [Mucuna pruriens]